jgi:hypothetical protein
MNKPILAFTTPYPNALYIKALVTTMRRYLALALFLSSIVGAQNAPSVDLLKTLKFREIGTANMGGRPQARAVARISCEPG